MSDTFGAPARDWFRGSIRWRASLLTSGLVAVVVAGLIWYVVRQVNQDLVRGAETRAQTTAQLLADQTALTSLQGLNRFQELVRDPVFGTVLLAPTDAARRDALDRLRRYSTSGSEQILEVWNTQGRLILQQRNPANSAARFPAQSPPTATGLAPLEADAGRLFTRVVSEVVTDRGGRREQLGFIQLISALKMSPTSTLNGVVGSGAKVLIGNQSGDVWTDLTGVSPVPAFDLARSGAQQFAGPNGEHLIGAASKITNTPWLVLVELPRDVVVAPAWTLLRRLLWVGVGFLVMTTMAAAALSGHVTTPLLALTTAVRKVTRGDYTSRVIAKRRDDEVGRLAEAFNDMAGEIEQGRQALELRAADLGAARESADHANRVKDEFLAVLSHELRTPLSAMLGWCRMLREGTVPPDKRTHALEVIERNAMSQLRLVEDLLDVSRIVAGKFSVDLQPIDPATIVQAAIESIQPVALGKRVQLSANISAGAGIVEGDAGRLQQAVWNLLSNALKFTPPGGRVSVAVRRVAATVEIVVRDSGQGINADELPRIFDRLEQGEGGFARHHSGLGLGLAIVRQVIALHGGSVHAESGGRDQGSTFRISIPCVQSPALASVTQGPLSRGDGNRPEISASIRGLRILAVEDADDGRELLAELLTTHGAKVTAVASAEAGLAWLERQPSDLIISDIEMPGQDGLEFLRRVRSQPSDALRRVPAIALTAYAAFDDRERSEAAGFHAHLSKPIDVDDLLTTIARLANRAPRTEEQREVPA